MSHHPPRGQRPAPATSRHRKGADPLAGVSAEQLGETRQALLARVHAALGRSNTPKNVQPPAIDPAIVRLAGPDDDLVTLFTQQAQQVGMTVTHEPIDYVPQHVAKLLCDASARRVGVVADGYAWGPAFDAAGLQWANQGQTPIRPDQQFALDAGVTDVHAALAETGTLICCSDHLHSRGLSLIPPLHIAVVRESDILPDMLDYVQRVSQSGSLPSSQSFITGPSKTADIEGQLVVGVHGPEAVHVVVAVGA